jgi:hypothetical protein
MNDQLTQSQYMQIQTLLGEPLEALDAQPRTGMAAGEKGAGTVLFLNGCTAPNALHPIAPNTGRASTSERSSV